MNFPLIIALLIAGLFITRLNFRLPLGLQRSAQQIGGVLMKPNFKANGQWKYYYRAADKQGQTIDFLQTSCRDQKAALRFIKKAIGKNRKPSLFNIYRSGANKAGMNQFNRDNNTRIKTRQCKYLNNIIEQDHRRIKRLTRPMMGFKNLHAAKRTLAGMEVMAMI